MSISGYVSRPRFPQNFLVLGQSLLRMREPRHPLATAFIELYLLAVEHESYGISSIGSVGNPQRNRLNCAKSIVYVATLAGFRDWKAVPVNHEQRPVSIPAHHELYVPY